jgi:hypothetical protein
MTWIQARPLGLDLMVPILALTLLAGCSKPQTAAGASAPEEARDDPHPVVVTAAVEKAKVDVGDTVKYVVTVRARKGFAPDLPACLENVPVFIDQGPWEKNTREDGRLEAVKWTTVDAGIGPYLTIPPAVVKFADDGGKPGEARSEETTVEVTSRLAAGEAIPDIRERLDIRIPAGPADARGVNWWVLGAAALVTLGLSAFAIRVFVRSRRAEIARPRPPWELALEELGWLRASGLVAAGRLEEFYVALSGIVRRYVERRFLIMAPEMTTDEFLLVARDHASLAAAHKDLLKGFLVACDLVKFARYVPEASEADEALVAAERLVRESSAADAMPTTTHHPMPAEAGRPKVLG